MNCFMFSIPLIDMVELYEVAITKLIFETGVKHHQTNKHATTRKHKLCNTRTYIQHTLYSLIHDIEQCIR